MLRPGSRFDGTIFAALALAAAISTATAETAETVLVNAKILTVDQDFSVREAIAIARGKVLATGAPTGTSTASAPR